MFSGIITSTGKITASEPLGDGASLTIAPHAMDLSEVGIGDSIAVNGVCLTVIELAADSFSVDVSAETLHCTTGFVLEDEVNLERALRVGDRLDGHMVTGHVDGVGLVTDYRQISESWHLVIQAPLTLARYIARKGSVAVNGVSLTTNLVDQTLFTINLIPHTVAVTTFKHLKEGDQVNLEVDIFARYIERMMDAQENEGDWA